MARKKPVRTRGKLKFSNYFQKFEKGDNVAVVAELSQEINFPKRLQGKTGLVDGKQGEVYIVKIKDISKEKKFLIKPIHLRKVK